jgi:hypothetical protein
MRTPFPNENAKARNTAKKLYVNNFASASLLTKTLVLDIFAIATTTTP